MPPRSQENAAAAPRASFSPRKGSAMEQTKREILPIKEQIARHRWKLDNRSIPMGIGCAEVSEYYGQGSEGSDLLLRCYEEGFRYFDTSRSYGNSELVVGEFLRQIDRKTIFLSTKSHFRPRDFGAEAFSRFRQNFFESFERLGVDHIDLFLIHDTDNIEICEKEVVPFLREQRDRGLIDYIGLGTRSLQAQIEGIASGAVDASESFLTYSLLKRSAVSAVRLAARKGTAWINASQLHFGVFKLEDPLAEAKDAVGSRRRELEMAAKMQDLCREMGVNIFSAALQYSLLDPDVDVVLNGIHRASNIDSTIRAMRDVIYPDQWAKILALQRTDPCMEIEDCSWWF